MRRARTLLAPLVLLALAGCASSGVSERHSELAPGERLARPDRVLVYRFAVTPEELPASSPAAAQLPAPATAPTAEELAAARKLSESVAVHLVREIGALGIPAVRGEREQPRLGDIAIQGYFASIDEGSAAARLVVGFGSGAAELKTVVRGYQMTESGLRPLGSATIDAGGGGGAPGMVLPLAVTILTANPLGLAIGGAAKVSQEAAGGGRIDAAGKRTAQRIAEELRARFVEQGWIEAP
jgi:hypothetical protein